MAVNYNDERFKAVEAEKNTELNKTTNTYNEMINDTDSYYQKQIDASKDWANKQQEIQQANTDFAIEKVNQQKEQAQKDYTKEQKGAYVDYTKATNKYGVNAEKQAAQGLQNSGYSESVQNSMYNTYQNRYMAARESFNKAILNYDNAIKEAQLANNSALATIAYEALQKQLELGLQGFQYKNTLVLQKTQALNEMNDRYYQRWQNVQSQINTENALAEQIRQYNESMAFQKQQAAQEQANWEKQYALSKAKTYSSGGSGGSSSSSIKLTDGTGGSKLTEGRSGSTGNSKGYSTVLTAARTMYNATKLVSPTKAKDSAERIIASGMANGSITQSEASKIIENLGLNSSSGKKSSSGGGSSNGGR